MSRVVPRPYQYALSRNNNFGSWRNGYDPILKRFSRIMTGTMKTLQDLFFVAYFCLVMIILGGTIFAVMVEYPNWFSAVPSSLEASRTFYKVLHPGYFFQIFGPLSLLAGIAFVVAGWRISSARNPVLISLAIFVGIELLTFIYIYPRLGILFDPAAASQPVGNLQVAADQFTTADRIRTVLAFIAGGFSIAALFRYFQFRYSSES